MIWIFLPAYNESVALPRLVRKFSEEMKHLNEPYRIVVLDDGSKDETLRVARELEVRFPLEVLRHEVNKGLGETMRDGIEYIAKNSKDDDVVVSLDCDDTHEPKYLPAAIKKLREGNYDLVILSRYTEGGGQEGLNAVKTFLSEGAGFFLKVFFPIKGVQEFSCNYRAYRASILKKAVATFGKDLIRLPHLGFVVTPEILIKLRMLKAKIGESPFVLRYDQKPTKSSNKPFRTIPGYFMLVWLYWGRKA
jgi:dolichol-phosphate mannosyltransferase